MSRASFRWKNHTSAVLLFLGVLADALHDLQPTEPSLVWPFSYFYEFEQVGHDYFTNHVVLSKVPSASYALSTFTTIYVTNFVGNEAFCSAVLPALEKGNHEIFGGWILPLDSPYFGSKSIIDISSEFASSKLLTPHTQWYQVYQRECPREGVRDVGGHFWPIPCLMFWLQTPSKSLRRFWKP